ncbi:MAG: DoxX family membrane protein [Steroidobacteraceae bacterium]
MNDDNASLAAFLLRLALGVIALAHGLLKIFVFTVPGTVQFFQSVGLPGALAYLVIAGEVLGGIALLLGVRTRWVSLGLLPIMLGATFVHVGNGWVFNAPNGGWEYPAFLAVAVLVQAILGDGRWALAPQPAAAAAAAAPRGAQPARAWRPHRHDRDGRTDVRLARRTDDRARRHAGRRDAARPRRTARSPRAILVVSAHWDTPAPRVQAAERPETIHDFSGFPRALYALRYAAPGAPAVGARVLSLLRAAGFSAEGDAQRGLDHGAWTPLMLMRAAADIPVLQLSLQSRLGPRHHYELGRALAPLAREGVLLLGSGSFTHNFAELRWQARLGDAAPWALEFRDWMRARAQHGDAGAARLPRPRAPRCTGPPDRRAPCCRCTSHARCCERCRWGRARGEPARRWRRARRARHGCGELRPGGRLESGAVVWASSTPRSTSSAPTTRCHRT